MTGSIELEATVSSEREAPANHRKRSSQNRAQNAVRNTRSEVAGNHNPWNRAHEQRPEHMEVDGSQPPMPGPGDERQRPGMREMGADNAHDWRLRVERQ